MLRDLPFRDPQLSADEQIFMTDNTVIDQTTTATSSELLDDIFGSAPSSPNLVADSNAGAENFAVHTQGEHSDIPRLRSIHATNGYREGIATSKERYIQAGFDEGYSLGGEIGIKAGWCLGVLDGVSKAVQRLDTQQHANLIARVQKLCAVAQEELREEALLSPVFFGSDGVWLYDVPGQDAEGDLDVTFADVAANHPLLLSWKLKVDDILHVLGLTLE